MTKKSDEDSRPFSYKFPRDTLVGGQNLRYRVDTVKRSEFMMKGFALIFRVLIAIIILNDAIAFNAPPGVLTWCGKAYESRYIYTCLYTSFDKYDN